MENRENWKDGRPLKGFDELYFEICSQVGKDGGRNKEVKKKKNEIDLSKTGEESSSSSDLSSLVRVTDILQKHPFIISKFSRSIQEYYEKKNQAKAQELFQIYCKEEKKFQSSKEGLNLLNHVLRLAPNPMTPTTQTTFPTIPNDLKDFEPVSLNGSENQNKNEASNFTVSVTKKKEEKVVSTKKLETEVNDDDDEEKNCSLVGQIYRARSVWFHKNSEHESCILDTYRSIRYGAVPSFSTLFTLATSYKEIGQETKALDLFEQALSFLRQSSFDNLTKSTQTIRIVRELKEIKSKSNLPPSTNLSGKLGSDGSKLKITQESESSERFQQERQLPKVELYEKSNPVLVSASDALELTYSKEMGRQLIATRTISPGTVLIVDPAYAWSLYPNSYGTHCQNCCRRVRSPVPCDHCSAVCYCDEECKNKFDPTHRYECRILKLLDSSKCLGEMSVLVYRTITRSQKIDIVRLETGTKTRIFGGSEEFSSSSPSLQITKNQFQLILGLDSEGQLNPLKFHSVSAQISNSTLRPESDLFKRTLVAIYFTLCLKFMKYFSSAQEDFQSLDSFTPENIQIASILLRILQSVSCNAYSISDIEGTRVREDFQINEIGGCTFPTVSCTNHSCAPNIYRYNDGNISIIRAIGTIGKGQPILDSYGPVYTTQDRDERQRVLEKQYFFTCNCIACRENWPIYSKLINIEKKSPVQEEEEQFTAATKNNNNTSSSIPHGKSRARTRRRKGKEAGCQNLSSKGIKDCSPDQTSDSALRDSVKKYLSSKESLISGKIITEDMESVFCTHLTLLEKLYSPPPHKLIVECQETLKLLWNLSMGKKDKGQNCS